MSGKRGLDSTQGGYGEYFWSEQYLKLSQDDYDLFLQVTTIQKYLQRIIKMQDQASHLYYPAPNQRVSDYFNILSTKFNPININYKNVNNLEYLSKIISNMGRSGYNYIRSYINVIDLNKPVLLFYGIEHLAAFYLNLHLNFTEENEELLKVPRHKLGAHGIEPSDFYSTKSNFELLNLINANIKLQKFGLSPRFFLLLHFPMEDLFLQQSRISLIELLYLFFLKLRIGIPRKIVQRFLDNFGDLVPKSEQEYSEDLDLFVYYTLSFIFSHLARYRMGTWRNILELEELDFGFIIKFVMKYISKLFIRKIFSLLIYYDDLHLRILRKK